MSYIGRQLNNLSDRVKLDSITASATATYNLLLNTVAYVPSSAESLTVSLNGVIQAPQSSYTVSGSQITFASALTSSDSIDFILAERSITLQTPSAGSVGTSQLASSAVTTAKINADAVDGTKIADDSISDEHLDITAITGQTEKTSLADADKFLISDSAASGALKYVQKSNLPSGTHVLIDEETTTSASAITVTGMDSTYKTYMMDIIDMNTSVDADLRMRYVYSSGPISNSYYQYAGTGFYSGASGSNWANNSLDYIKLLGETIRHDSGMSAALRLFISNPSSTSNQKRCFWMGGAQRTGDYTFSAQGSSNYYGSTPAITGLYVYLSSGNFDNVTIKLYGVK